ncbi:LysR family transcriptional regulator [Companilactobacillus furfuricola]|uniref:LysR family transcriptional regulator n=1 Tax=Companilactobacillus furfuricola TaxID=1462575 RepID=UPI000F7AE05F|nr:LysR family transcriptional regulator [Companilactobacillus furfuricola]
MDIRVLRYFIAIAEELNFSHAAARLHVSQPALSRQIAELENQLGTKLFIRGNRQIQMTQDGYYLQEQANEILNLVDKTTFNLQRQDTVSGVLDIGAGESIVLRPMMESIQRVIYQNPAIKVNIHSGDSLNTLAELDSGILEFSAMMGDKKYENYHSLKFPTVNHWGVLMRKDEQIASLETIKPTDLVGRPLITSRQSQISEFFEEWSHGLSLQYNYIGTYNLIFNAMLLVETGACMALTYESLVDTSNTELVFKRLSPDLTEGASLIWSKKRKLPEAGQLFIEQLKKELE